ncbi:MAG: sulfotransferase [Singulisphaera sp.]|nr:sulfotransferase [Singulisphaera sp.]
MGRGPDFIIIGAMKCATSTLHEQLAIQSGLFMSRPKEPNFFSDDDIYAKGWDWYRGIFEGADERALCGESSTHYTKLPTYPHTVARIRRHLPRVKLIYIMRDPIERLISHYLHETIRGRINVSVDQAIEQHPELTAYGLYSRQLESYLEAFGREGVLPVFFEHLVAHPQEELERICRFIGYEGRPRWDFSMKAQNVTSEQLRKSVIRETIVNVSLLRRIRRWLVPRHWNERFKAFWRTTSERPMLMPESVQRLHAVFDADLARLGARLGVEITSATFREVASAGPHEWVEPQAYVSGGDPGGAFETVAPRHRWRIAPQGVNPPARQVCGSSRRREGPP